MTEKDEFRRSKFIFSECETALDAEARPLRSVDLQPRVGNVGPALSRPGPTESRTYVMTTSRGSIRRGS